MGESAGKEAEMLRESIFLLKHKITVHGKACSSELLDLLKMSLQEVLKESSSIVASGAERPDWFIPRHELDIDIDVLYLFIRTRFSKHEVVTSGRWTRSIVKPHKDSREAFLTAVDTWYKLSHPNVAKVCGASYNNPDKSLCSRVSQAQVYSAT